MKIFNNLIKKIEFLNITLSTLGVLSCVPYLYFSDIGLLLGKLGVVIATFFLLWSYFILGYIYRTYERPTLGVCRIRMVLSDVNKNLYRFISMVFLILTLTALLGYVDVNSGFTSFYCVSFLYVSRMSQIKAEEYRGVIDKVMGF